MNQEKTLGERLREERQRLGLNQTDMAALVGASKHAQINWEKNVASPNANDLATWSESGLDITYVVTGVREVRKAKTQQELALLKQAIDQVINGQGDASVRVSEAVVKRYNELYRSAVDEGNHPGIDLTEREQAMLAKYRSASEEDKRLVERLVAHPVQGQPQTSISSGAITVSGDGNIVGHGNQTTTNRTKRASKKAIK